MAPARKSGADRRAEIVAAAIRLAAERGPDRVSAQALAEAVGVSQPAIFRHFPDKAAIWQAVGAAITQALSTERMQAEPGQARAALGAAVRRNLAHVEANPAIPAILFSRELHAENEPLRAHFETLMRQRREGFAALIAQAQDEGGLARGLAPGDGAALILATIQGLAMRWSLEGRRFGLAQEGLRLIEAMLGGAEG